LAFYGYLGFHDEDGIAIDSIAVKPPRNPPTTDLVTIPLPATPLGPQHPRIDNYFNFIITKKLFIS